MSLLSIGVDRYESQLEERYFWHKDASGEQVFDNDEWAITIGSHRTRTVDSKFFL